MSIEKEKINEVQKKILASDLRESHKDAIDDMLRLAGAATNGVENKTQALTEAMASLAVCFARDALYRREDFRTLMKEALEAHTDNCPLKGKTDSGEVSADSIVQAVLANLPQGRAAFGSPAMWVSLAIMGICVTILAVKFL